MPVSSSDYPQQCSHPCTGYSFRRNDSHALAPDSDDAPAVAQALNCLECQAREDQNRALRAELQARDREFLFLHEISSAIQSCVDPEEVIALALTAITAGQGFGLNRAMLLLVDQGRQQLSGYHAVGPRHLAEAEHIWREIERNHLSLQQMAQHFLENGMASEKEKFRDLLEHLSVPLNHEDHLFVQVLNSGETRHVANLWCEPHIERHQAEALGVAEMILVPLCSRQRRVGLLLADNIVNQRPIGAKDIRSLEAFALPLSFALERAALHEQLQNELAKLREANQKLQTQQEQIVRMEKTALSSQLIAHIAHSFRNPLAIIGGFARMLSRSLAADSRQGPLAASILEQTRKLEATLTEVLNHGEALHPSLASWDINQVIIDTHAAIVDELRERGDYYNLALAPQLPAVHVDFKQISFCLRNLLLLGARRNEGSAELWLRTRREQQWLSVAISSHPEERTLPLFRQQEQHGDTQPAPRPEDDLIFSLCTRIIEAHHGDLRRESHPDGSCLILIHLPFAAHDTAA